MESFGNIENSLWNPLGLLGLDYDFLKINIATVTNTWFVLVLIIFIILIARFFFNNKQGITRYFVISYVDSFKDLTTQTFGSFIYQHFSFITVLFTFILMCNCLAIIPWTSEPTKDLNTTLALGLIAFFYKEIQTIKTNGFSGYFKEFIQPFFIMFPINVIGHFSKIISMSFRLFGNIFGGAVIMELYTHAIAGSLVWEILGIFTGINFLVVLFFGVFEGFIQAFVFTMLTLTYIALAIRKEPAGES